MQDWWFLDETWQGTLSFVKEESETGMLRVREHHWEHAVLDLDPVAGTATERNQYGTQTEDPATWTSETLPLQQTGDSWSVLISADEVRGWIAAKEADVAHFREFGTRFPIHAPSMERHIRACEQVLERARLVKHGWVPLVPAIAEMLPDTSSDG